VHMAKRRRSMSRDDVLAYCGSLPESIDSQPFGDEVVVFKVAGKMFAIVGLEEPPVVTLKCDPELALELRDRYAAVRPGYHTNKRHWNTVDLDGTLHADEIQEMIDHSYERVVAGLPRKERERLAGA